MAARPCRPLLSCFPFSRLSLPTPARLVMHSSLIAVPALSRWVRQRSISSTVISASGLDYHSPKQVAMRCRVRFAPWGRFAINHGRFAPRTNGSASRPRCCPTHRVSHRPAHHGTAAIDPRGLPRSAHGGSRVPGGHRARYPQRRGGTRHTGPRRASAPAHDARRLRRCARRRVRQGDPHPAAARCDSEYFHFTVRGALL